MDTITMALLPALSVIRENYGTKLLFTVKWVVGILGFDSRLGKQALSVHRVRFYRWTVKQ